MLVVLVIGMRAVIFEDHWISSSILMSCGIVFLILTGMPGLPVCILFVISGIIIMMHNKRAATTHEQVWKSSVPRF